MSKSANDTLFGITLTELVIILFFIMLLLAMANIQELTERIPENEDDIVPASTVIDLLIPNGEINSDLIPLDLIKEEIAKLQEDKEELEEMRQLAEGEGDGDCKEGGNWINSKCADLCWAIDSEGSKRNYDVLLDIGMCQNTLVVKRSQWLENNESNFVQVPGALEAAQQNVMSKGELYAYLDDIKKPGYEKTPKQCFHVVRLVQLEQIYADPWTKNLKEVQQRVSAELYTLNDYGYKNIREQFPEDICNVVNESQRAPIKNVGNDVPEIKSFQEPISKIVNKTFSESTLTIVNAKLEFSSFIDAFTKECTRSNATRNDEVSFNYEISLNNKGKVMDVRSLSENTLVNSSLKRLDSMTKRAIRRSNFTPKYLEGIAVSSTLIQKIPFGQNACN